MALQAKNKISLLVWRCGGGHRVRPQPSQWPPVAMWETQAGSYICVICGECFFFFSIFFTMDVKFQTTTEMEIKLQTTSALYLAEWNISKSIENDLNSLVESPWPTIRLCSFRLNCWCSLMRSGNCTFFPWAEKKQNTFQFSSESCYWLAAIDG